MKEQDVSYSTLSKRGEVMHSAERELRAFLDIHNRKCHRISGSITMDDSDSLEWGCECGAKLSLSLNGYMEPPEIEPKSGFAANIVRKLRLF